MWITAKNTEKTFKEIFDLIDKTMLFYVKSIQEIDDNMDKIDQHIRKIEKKDENFINNIAGVIKWG
jgi:Mg2+ and Co2+ transporter CorA